MLFRQLGVLACLFALTSCIVTYREVPELDRQADLVNQKKMPLYFDTKVEQMQVIDARKSVSPSREARQIGFVPNNINPMYWWFYPTVPSGEADRRLLTIIEKSPVFRETIASPHPPEHGMFVSVKILEKYPGKEAQGWPLFLHGLTLSIIPYFPDPEFIYLVAFRLHVDQELKHTYEYEIHKKGGMGILLLPFAWFNFFTDNEEDALRAVFNQFLLDAEHDGHLAMH